jgi:hypothetical protein
MKKDGFMDAFSSPQQNALSTKWDASGAKLDKVILVAQAAPASSKSGVFVHASPTGADVGVAKEFTSWSDLTAVFRPSRWKSPVAEGGSLSWLNYKAWAAAPARTGKVLGGEVLTAAAAYWTVDGIDHYYQRHNGHGGSNAGGEDGGEMPF